MGTQPASPSLGDALFGKARREVLSLLLGSPDRRFYLREIIRHTGVGTGAVQRELARLVAVGIITREREGRQAYFQANRSAPVFEELQGLILKTAGLADHLRRALAPLGDRIQVAFIFGSVARRTDRASSDIDLMVIGEAGFAEVVAALASAERRIGREVNAVVHGPAEFRSRVLGGRHFVTALLGQEKLFLIGGPDELGRLAGEPLDRGASDEPGGDRGPAGDRGAGHRPERD